MRINSHAHLFNLRTVLTTKAVTIMVNRLTEHGVPPFVTEAVAKLLADQVVRPEHLTEDELLRRLLGTIGRRSGFRAFLDSRAGVVPPELLDLSGEVIRALPRDDLWGAFDQLTTLVDTARPAGTAGLFNVYETLRIALRPSVLSVADDLLRDHGPDDAVVALMMDITAGADGARDQGLFERQLRETGDLIVQRPGRVLPFVAVNPQRPGHLELMKEALERQGFVGVKLYPSLGYEVDTPEMEKIFSYCVLHDYPLLTHCTDGGFYESRETTHLANPAHWEPVLERHPGLRVCFAHCGGAAGLASGAGPTPGSWSETVIALARKYDGVYADIALHVLMMGDPQKEGHYLDNLRALIHDPQLEDRILFGTDWWLLRLHTTENQFWRYFTERLSAAELHSMALRGPARFLGLPVDGIEAGANITRYLERIRTSAAGLGAPPAAWARDALLGADPSLRFHVRRVVAEWATNQAAHVETWRGLKQIRLVPKRFEEIPFEEAGHLFVRQLKHWRKRFESAAQFKRRCLAAGQSLAQYCFRVPAGFEGDHTSRSAIDALADTFADGDLTLAQMAAVVDSIFRFREEDR